MKTLKLLCVSDTHRQHLVFKGRGWLPQPGEYDVLVHSGDATGRGSVQDVTDFGRWLEEMEELFKHIIYVPGNHDFLFQDDEEQARKLLPPSVHCLINQAVEIEGIKFYGSPFTPEFYDWAFMYRRGRGHLYWDQIPPDTDVLVTHGPPLGILDGIREDVLTMQPDGSEKWEWKTVHVGCAELRVAVERVAPQVHVFGHIHEGYGQKQIAGTLYVNPATMDGSYRFVNPPIAVTVTK